jgi:hypothetical protein
VGFFASSIYNDWQWWDEREDVTYTSHLTAGDVEYSITSSIAGKTGGAKRSRLTFTEAAPSDAVYIDEDLALLIPVANIPSGLVPKIGDRWISTVDNVTYTIIGPAQLNSWRTWYYLPSRDMVLAEGLRDLVDIWIPTNTQDASGNRVPSYGDAPLYAAIPARLQPMVIQNTDTFEKLELVTRFTCFLGIQVNVTSEMQVFITGDESGAVYQIRAVNEPARIDKLMSLDLELIP